MVANFTKATADAPSLLTHDEVSPPASSCPPSLTPFDHLTHPWLGLKVRKSTMKLRGLTWEDFLLLIIVAACVAINSVTLLQKVLHHMGYFSYNVLLPYLEILFKRILRNTIILLLFGGCLEQVTWKNIDKTCVKLPFIACLGPNFIELLKQKILLDTFLLSRIPITNGTFDMVVWVVTLYCGTHRICCAYLLFVLKQLYEILPRAWVQCSSLHGHNTLLRSNLAAYPILISKIVLC